MDPTIIILPELFGLIGFLLWIALTARRRRLQLMSDFHMRLFHRPGSLKEFSDCVRTEEGQALMTSASEPLTSWSARWVWRTIAVVLVAVLIPELGHARQSAPQIRELPRPTGPLPVGRVTLHLSDSIRREPVSLGGGSRELIVDIWYPAEPAEGTPAPYFDPLSFSDAASADRLRGLLRGAYDDIREGRVKTHARQRVPFARSVRRAPLLIFSHGGGEAREIYSGQLEDLASHGFVVAAISHTQTSVTCRSCSPRRPVRLRPAPRFSNPFVPLLVLFSTRP